MLRIKSRLALVPLLRLSKSKPHGRYGPRRQLRPSAMPGFDFVGDAKARVFSVGDGALDVPKPSLGGRWPRSGRMREGRPSRPSSVSLPLDSFPPGEAMSGRGVPVPGRRSADCGGDAFTLQRLMGHSTLNMTKHYCSIYDADIAKNYDRVSPLAQIQKPRETIKM